MMLWSAKPTIDADEEAWQLLTWRWLLDNLGGLETLQSVKTRYPTHKDFPKSGLSGREHVRFVFARIAEIMGVDPSDFEIAPQDGAIDPSLGPLAVITGAPLDPAGTYSYKGDVHRITYEPTAARDLEHLIATLAHEICHPILLAIPTPPPGGEDAEEFATDLATVFYGFGLFGGNQAFRFNQFRDEATGTQGWSAQRFGYLSQNEWGYALAVRAILCGEVVPTIEQFAADGLLINFRKNLRYLRKNPRVLEALQ